jgi:hypothetical protein
LPRSPSGGAHDGRGAPYIAAMHSRYDAATLPAPADRSRLGSGWLSGLALSLALRAALRLVAVLR